MSSREVVWISRESSFLVSGNALEEKAAAFRARFLFGLDAMKRKLVLQADYADGWIGHAVLSGFDVTGDAALEAGVGADFDGEVIPAVELISCGVNGACVAGLEAM